MITFDTDQLIRIIRGNNVAFGSLYYDELISTDAYQLSFLDDDEADPFYNCAHALQSTNQKAFSEIEQFYADRETPAAIYTDPAAPADLHKRLIDNGYTHIPEQEEHWYVLDLLSDAQRVPAPESHLGLDPAASASAFEIVQVSAEDAKRLAEFIDVDAVSNQLPNSIAERVRQRLQQPHIASTNVLLLALVEGNPAATSAVSTEGSIAYFTEGGTLPEYRRTGLYSALLQRRIQIAHELGCQFAVRTCASDAHSGPASAKLGFEHVFSRHYFAKTF